MTEIASVSTLTDNDHLLSRDKALRLVEILASCLNKEINDQHSYSEAVQNFIAQQIKVDLYTPLTASIVWQDKPEEVLANTDAAELNKVDSFNRTALTYAIANENFQLALKLVYAGAIFFLEDKLSLEIAVVNIIQRDPANIELILNASNDDKSWVGEYLDYLNSALTNKSANNTSNKRDILQPVVREFGQMLDTMVYFNGTPSHFGFISPSINALSQHLAKYAETATEFEDMAKIFNKFCKDSKFTANMPQAAKCYELLAKDIEIGKEVNHLIIGGFAGNCVALALVRDKLVYCNFGVGGDPNSGIKVYKLKNRKALTAGMLERLISGTACALSCVEFLASLAELIESPPLNSYTLELEAIDNCVYINPRAIIYGVLVAEGIDEQRVAMLYKSYLSSLHASFAKDLAAFMRNHDNMKQKRIESCQLAIEYINQHFQDDNALVNCLELRNALEYVGFRDFCKSTILPEAQAAIAGYVISLQEVEALRTIEFEAGLGQEPQVGANES